MKTLALLLVSSLLFFGSEKRAFAIVLALGLILSAGALQVQAATCDATTLAQKFAAAADIVASFVDPADRSLVLTAVAPYPEGSTPPAAILNASSQYQIQIPSKAAAYYTAGVDAMFQGNKLVAGWAFLEAARRNPTEPTFLNNVAFILMQYSLFADARDVLQCAVSLAPDFTSAHVNLGAALGNLRDHAGAANSYLNAVVLKPANADYLYLAAVEYARSGYTPVAAALAQMGQNVPSQYDFTGFLNSLPSGPSPPTCSVPLPPWSSAAESFVVTDHPYSMLTNYITPLNDHESRVLAPALDQALGTQTACRTSEAQALSVCKNGCNGDPLCLAKCACQHEPLIQKCSLTRAQSEYSAYLQHAGYWNGLLGAWLGIEQGMLGAVRGQVSSAEYAFLACTVADGDYGQFGAFLEQTGANLSSALQDISIERSNLSGVINLYCSGSIETWLYTGGPGGSLEPQWCLGFICFSYDAVDQSVAVSGALLIAGKLSKNLVTGDWGVELGVGAQFGIGQLALGGGIYLKVSEGKVGVEPKVSYGPGEAKYFMGFQRLSVPLGQYVPPGL